MRMTPKAILAGACLAISLSAGASKAQSNQSIPVQFVPFELKGFKLGSPLSELKARYPSVLCEDQSELKPQYRTMKPGDAHCWKHSHNEPNAIELLHFVGSAITATNISFEYRRNVLEDILVYMPDSLFPDIERAMTKKYGKPSWITGHRPDGSTYRNLEWVNKHGQEIIVREYDGGMTGLEKLLFNSSTPQMSIEITSFSYLYNEAQERKRQQDRNDRQL